MNKFKFSLLALMLASGCYLPAAITWDFANVKDRKNWTFNRWAGFLPHPQMEFDEKQNALHVFNSKSKAGFGMVNYRDKIAAEAGNKIKISLAVKGNGEISVGIENYSLGKWIAPDKKVVFPLTDKWQEITLELPVKDLKNKKTDEVLCGFQVSKTENFSSANSQQKLPVVNIRATSSFRYSGRCLQKWIRLTLPPQPTLSQFRQNSTISKEGKCFFLPEPLISKNMQGQ